MRLDDSASGNWLLRTASCAGISIVALWGLAALLGSVMAPYRIIGQSASCRANLMRVTRAFQMYADDYEDAYPPSQNWMRLAELYVDRPDRLRCPTVAGSNKDAYGYAMNTGIAGKVRGKIEDLAKTPVVFDSTNLGRDAGDALLSLPNPGRHRARSGKGQPIRPGNNVGYADGSVKMRFDGPGFASPQQPAQPR